MACAFWSVDKEIQEGMGSFLLDEILFIEYRLRLLQPSVAFDNFIDDSRHEPAGGGAPQKRRKRAENHALRRSDLSENTWFFQPRIF
jgi:hypothetical protein